LTIEQKAEEINLLSYRNNFDVCIIGAGFSGIPIAKTLVANNIDTIVVESGSTLSQWAFNKKLKSLAEYDYTGNVDYPLLRTKARLFGGNSNFWTGRCERLTPSDYAGHPYTPYGNPWPVTYNEMDPYYEKAEYLLNVRGDKPSEFAPPRNAPYPVPFSPNVSSLKELMAKAGIVADDSPTATPNEAIRFFRMQNEILPSFINSRFLTLLKGTTVTKLIPDSTKKIVAAEIANLDGVRKKIFAKVFIVACGGIETPRLLLLSQSEIYPTGIGNYFDRVGRGFNEHPGVNFYGKISHSKNTIHPHIKIVRTRQFYETFRKEGLGSIFPVLRQGIILPHHISALKLKNIPRQVFILGLVSFATDIASEMLYPVAPIFLSSVLGVSMISIGLIEGAAEFTAGILKGYFGFLSDKLKRRSIFVTLGYSLSALSKPLPGIFPNFEIVFGTRIAERIGKGIRTAPRDALLASYSEGNSGAVFGFHRGMDTLGAAIGPIISLVLLAVYPNNYKLIFLIAFLPSIIAVALTFFVKDKFVESSKKKNINYFEFLKSAPYEFKLILILLTLFSFVNSSDVFLILKSKDISNSDFVSISGYIFYNLVYAFSSFPIGIISDKFGKKKIFIFGLIIFSIVYSGFAFSKNLIFVFVLFALYGIYAASTEGIAKAWISDLIPDFQRGTAIGLFTTLSSLAVMSGSILTGFLWDKFGSSIPFLISSAASFLIAILLFVFGSNQFRMKIKT